ncbi:MAG: hypothetical protein KAX27_03770 [Candidatus Aminicenantes bacterium]|nr:hypothetical protein [Candidatus Aminicenantes bacterium]
MNSPSYLRYYLGLNRKSSNNNDLPTLENLKKEYISYLLELTNNNISDAAEILTVSRDSLCNRLRK